MILFRKSPQLRVRRSSAPEPPFCPAAIVSPYGPRRSEPIAIDYPSLHATAVERAEVTVCENVEPPLAAARLDTLPHGARVLIDATGAGEETFRKGNETAAWCGARAIPSLLIVSAAGALPETPPERSLTAIAITPDVSAASAIATFEAASARGLAWGAFVPVLFPLTTELRLLDELADAATLHGATFLACASVDADAPARQAIARRMELSPDDDRYALLFHARAEPLQLATERHLAALARERGLADQLPAPPERANWNAAALLTLTAGRMLAMELDLDLAADISRSARTVAGLDKPLTRIAESARLSIIGGLDETSVQMLEEWLESGGASFAEFIDEQWALRRA